MVTDPVKEIVTARPSKIGVCKVGVVLLADMETHVREPTW
jgi:hypothetical protein